MRFRTARDQIQARLEVLAALLDLPEGPEAQEFHASVRVKDLAKSTRFYAWLLGAEPKEWTHRYSTFVRPELRTNFVLVVSDGKELHHDTLYHLGIAVADKATVVRSYELAKVAGLTVNKPPRTTWRGTPLHELWLEDPDGNLVEVYARLTSDELGKGSRGAHMSHDSAQNERSALAEALSLGCQQSCDRLEQLLEHTRIDDPEQGRIIFEKLDHQLRAKMALEEELMLAAFRLEAQEPAELFCADHRELCGPLDLLALELRQNSLSRGTADSLLCLLSDAAVSIRGVAYSQRHPARLSNGQAPFATCQPDLPFRGRRAQDRVEATRVSSRASRCSSSSGVSVHVVMCSDLTRALACDSLRYVCAVRSRVPSKDPCSAADEFADLSVDAQSERRRRPITPANRE